MANILTFPISLVLNGQAGTDFGVAVDLDGSEVTGTLPVSKGGTGITAFGTGVATAFGVNIGSAGAILTFNGDAGTPSALVGTNISGTAASLTAGNVTTNANLTGHVTSTGNAAVLGSFTLAQLNTAVSDADVAQLGVTAGTAVQVDQAVTAWTRAATTTLGTTLNGTLSDTSTTITAFGGVAGVTYHCRCLGAGAITHHATDLIITQTSASIAATAAGDTFDVEMLTATTCRLKNYLKADGTALVATAASVGDHEVWVTSSNGQGSTNTKIRRFTTTITNVGTAITYADSAANGASFTINETGIYAIHYAEEAIGSGQGWGVSRNSTQLTSIIQNITAADRLCYVQATNDVYQGTQTVSRTLRLTAGDVIRPHISTTAPAGTGVTGMFIITKVGS